MDEEAEAMLEEIEALAMMTAFRLDMGRLHRGEPATLGYVLLERAYHPAAAVVFPSPQDAHEALNDISANKDYNMLLTSLFEEDALGSWIPDAITLADLRGKEIILA